MKAFWRGLGAVLAALVAWTFVATLGNLVLRYSWPGYAAVEKELAFTLGMMLARLALGAAATLCAGVVVAWISRRSWTAAGCLAALLLGMFVPVHYGLWDRFPAWYHLTFLVSLPVLTLAGAALRRAR